MHERACAASKNITDSQMTTTIAASHVKLKRAYAPPTPDDGMRILVDRLWPRGIKKVDAALDRWEKELAPSTALRQWFAHDPARWDDFRRRYTQELQQHSQQLQELRTLARKGTITLVYGAHDEEHNDAVVLREVLLA